MNPDSAGRCIGCTELRLVDPRRGALICGIDVPRELYWVLTHPAPLAGMSYPRADVPWSALAAAGFTELVSLHPGRYDCAPLRLLFSHHLEDLHRGGEPIDAERESRLIAEAVDATVEALRQGRGVL